MNYFNEVIIDYIEIISIFVVPNTLTTQTMKKTIFFAIVLITILCSANHSNAQCGYVTPPVGQNDTTVLKMHSTISLIASGTNLKWYSDSLHIVLLGSGSPFSYTFDPANFPDTAQFYVTQTIGGCESKPFGINWYFIKCPWKAPVSIGVKTCENDPSLYIKTLQASTLEPLPSWQWYDDNRTKIAYATTDSYNPYINIADTNTFYVSYSKIEPITGEACSSPLSAVQYIIYPKPTPEFVGLNSDYCYNEGIIYLRGQDSRTLSGTDQFTVNGIVSGSNFISLYNTFNSFTDEVTYKRTTDEGCSDSVTKLITIHYVAPPITTCYNYKVIGVGDLPTIKATPSPITNSIQWYGFDANHTIIPGATNSVLTGSLPEPTTASNRIYYVKQTDAYGCVSLFDTTTIYYRTCQADTPATVNASMCTYDKVQPMKLIRGVNSNASHLYEYHIYLPLDPDFDLFIIPRDIISSTSSSYDPSSDLPSPLYAANYQFWVAEYDLTDKCMGKASEFLLSTFATAAPTAPSRISICKGEKSTISLMAFDILFQTSSVYWYDSTATLMASADHFGSLFQSNPYVITGIDTLPVGTYKYLVSQTVQGCQSSKTEVSFTINPIPTKPIVTTASSCVGMPFTALQSSNTDPNISVNWYSDSSCSTKSLLLKNGTSYMPTSQMLNESGVHQFFVTDSSSNGCTSAITNVNYTLFAQPTIAGLVADTTAMTYGQTKVFSIKNQTGTIEWSVNETLLSDSTSLAFAPDRTGTFAITMQYSAMVYNSNKSDSSVCAALPFNLTQRVLTIFEKDTTFNYSADSNNITILLTCNGPWTANSSQSWIHFNPTAGTGNTSITITLDENSNTQARNGVLSFTSNESISLKSNYTKTLTINQAAVTVSEIKDVAQMPKLFKVIGNTILFSTTQSSIYNVLGQCISKDNASVVLPNGYYFVGTAHGVDKVVIAQ
jgi:hypothetical protein